MNSLTNVLALIPARGGSKGVLRKNIRLLAGKPLIAYSIDVARSVAQIARVIVSTEDMEIAGIAQQYGADVPFMRPAELAQDDTPGIAPVMHAIQWLEEHEGYLPDYVLLLQPTSPFRTTLDVVASMDLMVRTGAETVVAVCKVKHHPFSTGSLSADGRLTEFPHLNSTTRRQDLPPAYALNGAIYLARREVLVRKETFFTDETYGHVMPQDRSYDLDSLNDFEVAEAIMAAQQRHEIHCDW